MKVSICIAAHNVGSYIEECLDSVLEQTMSDFEVLIVNDGSTDNTKEKIQKFTKCDSRFKLIDSVNRGVASARNLALSQCVGEYILILDSDDYLHENCLEIALRKIELNDILIFNYYKKYEDKIIKGFHFKNFDVRDVKVVRKMAIEAIELEPNPWGKLYKREVFSNLRYPEGILYEDYAVFYELLNNKKIKILDEHLYYYRIRNGSIMRSFSHRHIDDKVNILDRLSVSLSLKHEEKLSADTASFLNSYIFHLVFVTSNMLFNSSGDIKRDLRYLQDKVDNSIFSTSNIITSKSLSKQVKIYLLMFKLNPYLCLLSKRLKNKLKASE